MKKPLIGITIGDPSGAGPEIALKALANTELKNNCFPILFGDVYVIEKVKKIVASSASVNIIEDVSDYRPDQINLVNLGSLTEPYEFAKVQSACGKAAFSYIERAIQYAIAGKIDAVVTGPIHKEALNLAGHNYSGHTEIFAGMTGTSDYAMMLTGGPLRVIHVSTHVSLKGACENLNQERVYKVIKLAEKAMKGLGLSDPVIGVAGLNPHCGEHGLFGTEEEEHIEPAISKAQHEGINVVGPIPPDTVFVHASKGRYDIVVAMYHDQGHIPLKLLDFMGGVNITVGLPIIRTSVDHGTVYGKAGKGTADETSMLKAIEMACQFARN